MSLQQFFFVLLLCIAEFVVAIHESFNFIIPPAKRECFFEDIGTSGPPFKVEAFIAAGGKLDAFLTIHGPLSKTQVLESNFENPIFKSKIDAQSESDSETQTFTTTLDPETPGTYAICLDNRHSHFIPKVVQLDVTPIYNEKDANLQLGIDWEQEIGPNDSARISASLKSLSEIHEGLRTILSQQQRDRHRLSLHSETNNSNYSTVFLGSIFETGVFIVVALFQIFFVRRWFASRVSATSVSGGKAKNWA